MKKICYAIVILTLFLAHGVSAQESAIPIIKPEVEKSQVMFKRTVWRRIDLKEKQNRPFFSRNGEIPRLLMDAVDAGLIKPYMSDSCLNVMADSTFNSGVTVERQSQGFGGFDSGFGGGFGSSGGGPPALRRAGAKADR